MLENSETGCRLLASWTVGIMDEVVRHPAESPMDGFMRVQEASSLHPADLSRNYEQDLNIIDAHRIVLTE